MIEELERLTREYFDVETEHNPHSHLDYVVAQVESGDPIASIASSLSITLKEPIRRQMVSDYLHRTFTDAGERLKQARPIMAEALAEDALIIIDSDAENKGDVAHLAARARTRESLAKMFNPDQFNPAKNGGLTINVGQLHLEALRAYNTAPRVPACVSLEPAVALVAPVTVSSGASDNSE